MNFISIDPGTHSGWAIFHQGRYWQSGVVRITSTKGALAIANIVSMALQFKLDFAVIEDSYPGGWRDNIGIYHPASYQTGKAIGIRRGQWEQEIRKAGIKIITLKPSQWQKVIHIKGFKAKRMLLKKLSLDLASQKAGKPITDENEADAICMGIYCLTKPSMCVKSNNYEDSNCNLQIDQRFIQRIR